MRQDIIDEAKKYFKIQELVSKTVYNAYGEGSWALLQSDILMCLCLIRVGINKPIHVNNWDNGGVFDERGFRENISDIASRKTEQGKLYTSGHLLGMAIDFHINGMSSEKVRDWIVEHEDIFPCKVRLERKLNGKPISWVHIDTKYYDDNPKVYLFDV